MAANDNLTVLHYTGSAWDGNGIHAVIRQLGQAAGFRSILGVQKGFVAEKYPRLHCWRGPKIETDKINLLNFFRALAIAWGMRRWLRRGPRRIYHGHSRAGLLVGLWLFLLGERRVVVSVHVYGRQRWFYRMASRVLGRRLIWLTPAMKRYYGIVDGSWTDCIPNGLALPFPDSIHARPSGQKLRIGGAGMMVGWKRWDLVLQAMARLPADYAAEFWHIGGAIDTMESRDCESDLWVLTQSLGLEGRVHWLGWQDSSAALLSNVDVLVVPSDGEPFSMIALEALFAGVPVIATRGGGPEDFIVEYENGWLVPAGDAEALARCFVQCLDPATWRTLRVSSDHLRKFSVPATVAAQWAQLYRSL